MKYTRRSWLMRAGLTSAALMAARRRAYATPGWSSSPPLTPFIQALRFPSIIQPSARQPTLNGVPLYELAQRATFQQVHPALPATQFFAYGDVNLPSGEMPGPTFVQFRGQPIKVKHINLLPPQHILPLDMSLAGMTDRTTGGVLPFTKTVVHLHGAHVAPYSDGNPEAWMSADGQRGAQYQKDFRQSDIYDYVNDQQAGLLWYHDHALSTTRLNVAAGLAGMYIIRDTYEMGLINSGALPSGLGTLEIPLVLQDKTFNADGSLWYPDFYDPGDLGPGTYPPLPSPTLVPEFFGDTVLVNGLAAPYFDVDPRQYRFRVLNASNSRFYHLSLVQSDSLGNLTNPRVPGPSMLQIGSDGAFMASPVTLASPTNPNSLKLYLAPSERADLIIDFSKYAGQYFVLYNDAAAPFPEGDPDNDEPTVQRIMLFRVANKPPVTSKPNPVLPAIQRLNANSATVTRDIELFENFDQCGRLIQQLGQNGVPENYFDIVNINPKIGATEVWRFINLTGDTHPIHIHLINFEVISRQNFDVDHYMETGSLLFTGPAMPPDPNEAGWKDVLRMNPGQVTKIIAQFNAPGAWAYPEGDYMIHCHIVEHEDHEMMRRFYLS